MFSAEFKKLVVVKCLRSVALENKTQWKFCALENEHVHGIPGFRKLKDLETKERHGGTK